MLADADLTGGEDLRKIAEQPQPLQSVGHMPARAGGRRRHRDALCRQRGQQRRRAGFGGDLVVVKIAQHRLNARFNFGGGLGQRVVGVQVFRALLHAH